MSLSREITTKRSAVACTLLFFLLSLGAGPADASKSEADPGFPVYLHADASFFVNNLEYFNRYQVGLTYLGAQTSLYFTADRPNFDLSLGVFLKREFGDEDGLSQAWPLFRFRYKTSWARLIFGFIDSSNNHGLPEAILSLQYPFVYPVEEGLQFLAHSGDLRADTWINWYLMNNPDHREFFAAGLRLSASWPLISCELDTRIAHHGGQLYEVGPVTTNIAGAARFTLSENWDALRADFGITGSLYGSYVDETVADIFATPTLFGYGGGPEFFFAPFGWRVYYEMFFGRDFYAEQGNPLYRTNEPLHRFGVRKVFSYDGLIRARFQAEGIVIESRVDYDYLLVIDVFLDFFLHRFGKSG